MAGSLRGFPYTADDGTTWALLNDESNVERVNGTGNALTAAQKYKIPRNLKPRVAVYQNGAGTIRRSVVVLTPATFNGLTAASTLIDQVSGETLQLRLKKGEVVSLLPLTDTGLTDGDLDGAAAGP